MGERTRTAEELAAAEAVRLEALEAARQRRMHGAPGGAGPGGDDADGDFEAPADAEAGAPAGGYAARRLKRRRTEAAGPSGGGAHFWFLGMRCAICNMLQCGLSEVGIDARRRAGGGLMPRGG